MARSSSHSAKLKMLVESFFHKLHLICNKGHDIFIGLALILFIGFSPPTYASSPKFEAKKNQIQKPEPEPETVKTEKLKTVTLENLLLFEVHLGKYMLAEGLSTYQDSNLIFLPLGEFSSILTLSVAPDADLLSASGFIINEERKFKLDLEKMTVNINGHTQAVSKNLVRSQKGEIFIESHLYSQWFPVDISLDTASLILTVIPREELPLQAKLKRDMINKNVQEGESGDLGFANLETPYEMIDTPFVDLTVEGFLTDSSHAANSTSGRYTALSVGDMLGLETSILISGTNSNLLDESRITGGRNDPDARLLGPLHARSFSVGHVILPSLNYVSRANSKAFGFVVGNRPLTKPTLFDTQNFSGPLLPGWDVELFQNGILIGRQRSEASSQYFFNEIPLVFGGNHFKLIFHGPLGQIREEEHHFLLEDSLVLPGDRYYSLGAIQLENGSSRAMSQFDFSLLSNLSSTVGFLTTTELASSYQTAEKTDKSYLNFGLRSYFDSLFLSTDAIIANDGGTLGAFGIKTNLGSLPLTVSHAILKDFSSEEFLVSSDPQIMKTKARLDAFIFKGTPLTLETSRTQTVANVENIETSGRVAFSFFGVSNVHKITVLNQGDFSSTHGEVGLSGRIRRWGLRGSYGYGIKPSFAGESVDLNADFRINEKYSFVSSMRTQLQTNQNHYELGLNKGLGDFSLGLRVGQSESSEKFLSLRLNAGLGIEPRHQDTFTRAQPITPTGAASIRVFIDKNLNGQFDPGETLVSGVGFRVNGSQESAKTNEQGIALITHLPVQAWTNIALDRSTLDDPQMLPVRRGVRLLPRPGKLAQIEFPLQISSEISGTVKYIDSKGLQFASGLELELVDFSDSNVIVGTTKTAHDGFYVFSEVPTGRYKVLLSKESAQRLSMISRDLNVVSVLPNSNFIGEIDMTIRRPVSNFEKVNPEQITSVFAGVIDRPRGHLYYVVLGAFNREESSQELRTKLDTLKIPFHLRVFRRELESYWITLSNAKGARPTEMDLANLKSFGFSNDVRKIETNVQGTTLGPYWQLWEAKQDKNILAAAFSEVKLTPKKDLRFLTEVLVGGFATKKQAEQAANIIRGFNFSEVSIQKRNSKDWYIK